jgi:NAD(P)-dependent dehydrogenase (short-subunit alcohol dehydrogenase family)
MKRVIITGGSRGLGFALGRSFGKRGAGVVLVARDRIGVDEAARALRGEGIDAHGLAFDVGAKADIHRIAALAAERIGPIDTLVHNASTLGPLPLGELSTLACEDFQEVLETNLLGPFRLTKALLGSMALRPEVRPTVVFVSSDAAVSAYPTWGAYGLTKAAADHLMRTFAAEAPEVRFFSVDPGEMDTAMHRAAVPDADRTTLASPAAVAEAIVLRIFDTATSGSRYVVGEAS